MTITANVAAPTGDHTPGPWEIDTHHGIAVHGEIGRVCRLPAYNTPRLLRQADANARLIAAAPDLLDALKEAEEVLSLLPHGYHGSTIGRLRTAIAKATR
jgi:hypothetical protein